MTIVEKNIIKSLEDMSVSFLHKNGWFISNNPNHPNDLYVKNTYPIAIQYDKKENEFWVYDPQKRIGNIDIMTPLRNEKEYDDLIFPILKQIR